MRLFLRASSTPLTKSGKPRHIHPCFVAGTGQMSLDAAVSHPPATSSSQPQRQSKPGAGVEETLIAIYSNDKRPITSRGWRRRNRDEHLAVQVTTLRRSPSHVGHGVEWDSGGQYHHRVMAWWDFQP